LPHRGRHDTFYQVRIGENTEDLEITMSFLGNRGVIHPALLWDDADGATLVDAGMPGQLAEIEGKLRDLGLKLTDIRRIFLTHQDVDHIGSAGDIARATGAEVFAHDADVPYIQGEKPLLKLNASRYESRLQALPKEQQDRVRALLSSPPSVRVDRVLNGGEELPFHGGIVVIPTPGHTPGHVCYYLKTQMLLIAGDALRVEDGSLIGPSPMATPDMRRAVSSLKNLQPYRIDAVLCYHGGLAQREVGSRLRDLAGIGS
jgi:glyoxylase-like metal-dependent hydrolase (beta-lactamase superfamily II)